MTQATNSFHEFEHRGWESVAAQYDLRFADLTMQSVGPLLDIVGAAPGLRLLDVACGPGYVAASAALLGSPVLGIDFSAEMISLARKQQPDLEFRQGDAEHLDLADGSFDAVVMNFGMLHLAQPERAIAEAYRVLRPGGRYAFTVWDSPERAVGFGIVLGAIQKHGEIQVPSLPEGPPFFRFSDPEESKVVLKAAGFVNVQVQQVPQVWRIESGEYLFTTFQTAAVRTAALLHMQTPQALERIRQEIADKAEDYRKGEWILLPMPAILTSALRPN